MAWSAGQRWKLWFPPIAWAGVIFIFSSEAFSAAHTSNVLDPFLRYLLPVLSDAAIDYVHIVLRKAGHFGEYFILAILLLRALSERGLKKLSLCQCALGLALSGLYAVSDEAHQAFVPNRSASIFDVFIDLVGAFCGTYWFHLRNSGRNPH